MNIKDLKVEEIRFLHDVIDTTSTKMYIDDDGELTYKKLDGSLIQLSDMTDTTYGSTIVTTATTYSIATSNAFATASDATHIHGAKNTQLVYNYNGLLTGNTNLAFDTTGQTLQVGKIELTTGVVSSFKMKDVYSATIYNVYLSGGTLTVAVP